MTVVANTVYLCPFYNGATQLTANGELNVNGNVWCYFAGTDTPANTYTSSTGRVLNPNPIQLGITGRLPSQIWIPQGQGMRFVVTDAANSEIDTQDQVYGTLDPTNFSDVSNLAYTTATVAYNTANAALANAHQNSVATLLTYAQTNASANLCSVYANVNTSINLSNTLVGNTLVLNFMNSSSINVAVTPSGDPNQVNVSLEATGTVLGGFSNANPGFATLAANVIMQFGRVNFPTAPPGRAYVTFATLFNVACYSCVVTMESTGVNGGNGWIPRVTGLSTLGFTILFDVYEQSANDFPVSGANVYWVATGQ